MDPSTNFTDINILPPIDPITVTEFNIVETNDNSIFSVLAEAIEPYFQFTENGFIISLEPIYYQKTTFESNHNEDLDIYVFNNKNEIKFAGDGENYDNWETGFDLSFGDGHSSVSVYENFDINMKNWVYPTSDYDFFQRNDTAAEKYDT